MRRTFATSTTAVSWRLCRAEAEPRLSALDDGLFIPAILDQHDHRQISYYGLRRGDGPRLGAVGRLVIEVG